MTPRMTVAIGSLLLAATTLVGCGGSSNNGSAYSSPTSPSSTTTSTPAPPATTPSTSGPTTGTYPDPGPAPDGVPAVADVVITINGMDAQEPFSPSAVTLKAGQTVAWVNKDSVPHTATGNSNAFNTGILAPGATSAPITMGTTGVFPYHCQIHPSMTGTLTVVTPVL